MSRISIQTAIVDGKQHVTVYLSDGITITERAGTSIIRTIIPAHIAHRRDQNKLKKQLKTQFAGIKHIENGKTTNTSAVSSGSAMQSTSITVPSFRITRFKSRVDGIGSGVQS